MGFEKFRGRGFNGALEFLEARFRDLLHRLQMLFREVKLFRIDNAAFDKRLRFARASAGISRIHQAAATLHESPEVAAGTRELLPEIVSAYVQDFTAQGVAGREDRTQYENQPLFPVQAKQHTQHASELRLFNEKIRFGRWTAARERVLVRRIVEKISQAFEPMHCLLRRAASEIERMIDDDSVRPGSKRAVASERRKAGRDFQQNFLGGILGIFPSLEHSQSQVIDPRLVAPEQYVECGCVTVDGPPSEIFVARVGSVVFPKGI